MLSRFFYFPEFCMGYLSTGKWDFRTKWTGKWDWFPPPSGPWRNSDREATEFDSISDQLKCFKIVICLMNDCTASKKQVEKKALGQVLSNYINIEKSNLISVINIIKMGTVSFTVIYFDCKVSRDWFQRFLCN